MSVQKPRSPFDRLRQTFEEDRRCRACGYVDADGGWHVAAVRGRVRYRRVCPSCDAVDVRDLRLG